MDFQQAIAEEKKRLGEEIQKATEAIAEANARLKTLQAELKALEAYEKAKTGAPPAAGKRRTGIRQQVLEIIKQHPTGIARADVLSAMDASTKQDEQAVSNALAALKKNGDVSGDQGVYKPS